MGKYCIQGCIYQRFAAKKCFFVDLLPKVYKIALSYVLADVCGSANRVNYAINQVFNKE
jgi:hypothetical protein